MLTKLQTIFIIRLIWFAVIFQTIAITVSAEEIQTSPIRPISQSLPVVYTAVASKYFSINTSYKILVSLEIGGSPATVSASISSPTMSFTSQEIDMLSGTSKQLLIHINRHTEFNSAEHFEFKLVLNVDGNNYENSTQVYPITKQSSILLQLDKRIYKPGETVKFRLIAINSNLKPETLNSLEVFVKDPQSNVIKHWPNVTTGEKGIFSNNFKLVSEPPLGQWIINIKPVNLDSSSFSEITEEFTVEQYVLPKFKVEVKPPKFATLSNSKIQVKLKAMYTYGKAIKGQGSLLITQTNNYDGSISINSNSRKIFPIDGSAFVPFDLKEYIDNTQLSYRDQYEFKFEASVTESVTGKIQNASSKIKLYKDDFKIEIVRQPEYSLPEAPLSWTIKIVTHDDMPIVTSGTELISIRFTRYNYNYYDYPQPFIRRIVRSPVKNPTPAVTVKPAAKQKNIIRPRPRPPRPPKGRSFPPPFQNSSQDSPVKYYDVPLTGIVTFEYENPVDGNFDQIEVTFRNTTTKFSFPTKRYNEEKFINLWFRNNVFDKEQNLQATVLTDSPINEFYYIFTSSNNVVLSSGKTVLNQPSKKYNWDISLKTIPGVTSESTITVYSVCPPNNQIVADSQKIQIRGLDFQLNNFLKISLSTEVSEPGSNVTLSLASKPNSLLALRGVDQSILILKEDKDITLKVIEDEAGKLGKPQGASNNEPYYFGNGDLLAAQVFHKSSLVLLTNGYLPKRTYIVYNNFAFGGAAPIPMMKFARRGGEAMVVNDEAPVAMAMMAAPSVVQMQVITVQPTLRKDFPETWIFEEIDSPTGLTDLIKKVPDTLTSWVITGLSLSPESGIGVTLNPSILKTFRPFFITLNVPYSIVKGETLMLQVLVHNYMDVEISAVVQFDNNAGNFQFPEDQEQTNPKRNIQVKANDVSSVQFPIIAQKFGILKLVLEGQTKTAGDRLSQPLIVKPPGHKQSRSKGILVDLRKERQSNVNLVPVFPPDRVAGADFIRLTVVADLLGSTISNLDKLLQMPCGCGEQNMLNFVPDIVIIEYLSATNKLTLDIKTKAIVFMEAGYQRELTYMHYDGSFSAFGQSDDSGSTWLTAFVAKSFIQAKKHITVDQKIIDRALEFLISKQKPEGSFVESGKIIHSELQGGSFKRDESGTDVPNSIGVSLSAYVILAFLEANKTLKSSPDGSTTTKYDEVIQNGLNFIASFSFVKDPYTINLITYALHLGNHAKKDVFFSKMEKLSKFDGNHRHWQKEVLDGKSSIGHSELFESKVQPVAVEMTSYALLTYLLRNEIVQSVEIGRWLLAQRNCEGGFISTQDTVVGLTALAEFAKITQGSEIQIKLLVEYESGGLALEINKDNSMVLQELTLPPEIRSVNLQASGKGTALVHLSWDYYVEDKPSQPAFTIDVQTQWKPDLLILQLDVCISYSTESGNDVQSKSNMALLEINLPSGYTFQKDNLDELRTVKLLMRFELEDRDTKLQVYFDHLDRNITCIQVNAHQEYKLENPAKAYVLVYDYYEPSKKSRAFYSPPKS